uniref:Uncharacterized protein n=1 Tax=Trichobilharzia regenti TaxID=157069 RepID=A0AA85JBQ0_TRIRE|nr:unnamed protein product [Trichobilharzia regenti]
MVKEDIVLLKGVVLLISLLIAIHDVKTYTLKDNLTDAIQQYSHVYQKAELVEYDLLKMATNKDLKFTQEQFEIEHQKVEREYMLTWAVAYLEAVKDIWGLRNNADIAKLQLQYSGESSKIPKNSCYHMESRTENENTRKTIRYGCDVMHKYASLKWQTRLHLDNLSAKYLQELDRRDSSEYLEDRGVNYFLKKEGFANAKAIMQIHRGFTEKYCLSALNEFIKYEGVKLSSDSNKQMKVLNDAVGNFNKSAEYLGEAVKIMEDRRMDFMRYDHPYRRAVALVKEMDEESKHEYATVRTYEERNQ